MIQDAAYRRRLRAPAAWRGRSRRPFDRVRARGGAVLGLAAALIAALLLLGCTVRVPADVARRMTDWLAGDCERPVITIIVPREGIEEVG